MKDKQYIWTEEDDLLLAETVLRHVREGSTQLNAFEEVGDKLNRTSGACGFRWNAVVHHNYEKAIQLAKKQRDENKVDKALELTTCQLIDQLQVGQIAVTSDGKMKVTKTKGGHIQDTSDDKFVFLNNAILNSKWHILPEYIDFDEAMSQLRDGEIVYYVGEEKNIRVMNHCDMGDCEFTYVTWNDLFGGKFYLEQ